MDLDKPLDDMIASNRKPRSGNANGGGGRPRQSRERGAPTPYARPPPRSTEDKWVHDAYSGPGSARTRGPSGAGQDSRDSRVAGSAAGFSGLSPRIEVIGLHYEVTPADLKTIFSQAGTLVQGPVIRYDRSGRSKGEATMEFASPQQAKIAINKFDGAMTKGQTISIRLLPPHTPRPAVRGAVSNGSAPGASLLSRMQGAPSGVPAQRGRGAPSGPSARGGSRGRGAPRGRGAAAGGRGGKRAPATGDDLDKDLDSFMAGGEKEGGDVDMA